MWFCGVSGKLERDHTQLVNKLEAEKKATEVWLLWFRCDLAKSTVVLMDVLSLLMLGGGRACSS